MSKTRNHLDDLRGASRLAIEATKGITDLVQAMHHTIGGGPAVLGRPLAAPTRVLTAPVYGSIRAVTQLVGASIDGALAQLAPLLGETRARPEHEAILAVLNGVLGDYLHVTNNPLAIAMGFRHGGRELVLETKELRAAIPHAGGKLLVLVHGSCMNDLQWNRRGHDHGAALARDLGYTPIYLHYNSGLHISTNGRALAALLDRLVAQWPTPIDELVVLGHSMGGLVARSACHYGELAQRSWRQQLGKLICLGSPHHGAPLERGGNWIDVLLGMTRYSAPLARLGQIRSAGVTDLRFGNVLDEHWEGRGRFELGRDRRDHDDGARPTARERRHGPRGQRARPMRPGRAHARVPGQTPVDRVRNGPPRPARQARGVRDDRVVAGGEAGAYRLGTSAELLANCAYFFAALPWEDA